MPDAVPNCRLCGQPMKLVNEAEQRWYCYKDGEVWFGKEQKWRMYGDQINPAFLDRLEREEHQKVLRTFAVLYIDGWANIRATQAHIYLLTNEVHIVCYPSGSIPIYGDPTNIQTDIPYERIELLNVTQEREITALRTWLVGPVLSAWLKKKTMILTIGFRNEFGLLEVPSFKVSDDEIDDCYRSISDRIHEVKVRH
jgi:hypothetical protein